MTTDPSTSHVCLVADTVTQHDASFANRTLEFTEATYLKAVVGGLTDAGFRVTHLDSPGALAAQAPALLREDAVVISLWSGTRTRTRRTLVPSTCEGLGLRYVGADAYSAIVCQDKDLAKSYAWRHGIAGPAGQVVDPGRPFEPDPRLTSPFVVKPLAEGGSIGIDQRAFCPGWEEAARQVATLQEALACPVLIEEFLEGDEVSICLMGADGDSAQLAAVRLDVEGFDLARGIWSMEVKKTLTRPTENTPITHALDPALLRACRRLFDSFEKVDYMRIDGRMTRDGFRLIELTPDVHLGPTASFAQSMASLGVEYPDMWRTLISLAT